MQRKLLTIVFTLAVSSCGSSDSEDSYQVSSVSNNSEVQTAYESCVSSTRKELKRDNPNTSADIMKFMYDGANQTCHSAVVNTCKNDHTSQSCKLVLDMYRE